MPQADGPGRPTPKKVVRKSVGKAVSGATKKPVHFGTKPKPGVANAGVGGAAKGKVVLKKNARTVNDPRGKPLKHAGVADEAIKKAGYAALSPLGRKTTVPVLKALDVAARPLYATMNAKKQELVNQGIGDPAKKGSVLKAAGRGLSGKDKTVGSDVLKQAGVKNRTARAVGGFALDTAVTAAYPGLRGGSLAGNAVENAGLREGERALKKAAKQGLKPEAQQNFKRMAARQAEKGRGVKKPLRKRVHYVDKETGKPVKAEKVRGAWVGVGYGREGQIRIKRRTDRTLLGEPKPRSKVATRVSNLVRGSGKDGRVTGGVADVRPTMRRNALDSPADHQKVLAVRAEERAVSNSAYDRAIHVQESIQRGLKREDYAKVVDAIERRTIGSLPDHLREPAVALRSSFRHQRRVRRRAGQPYAVGGKTPAKRITQKELGDMRPAKSGNPKDVLKYVDRMEARAAKHPDRGPKPSKMGYVPHMREADIRGGKVNTDEVIYGTRKGPGAVGTTKKREVKQPISAQNPKLPADKKYSTDLSVVTPNSLIQTGRVEAKAQTAKGFSEVGSPVKVALAKTKKGTLKRRLAVPEIADHQVLVHIGSPSRKIGGGGPRVVAIDGEGAKALASGKGFDGAFKGGQFRVVDKNALRTLKEAGYDYKSLKYDKVLSGWKSLATATPTFQVRNLVGDTERAFTQIPRRKMPRLMAEAPRISRFMRSQQFRVAGPAIKRKGGLKSGDMIDLGKSGKMTVDDFVKELKAQHIISAGIRGQDIRASGSMGRDIAFGNDVGKTARVHRAVKDTMSADYGNLPSRRVGEALQTRENLSYIMVYKHFREEGFSPRRARAKTMDRMIDYGELTPFEAGTARRIAPFYTFSARVVPAYAKAFVKDPGKIANYEALRQEVGNFFGVDANDIEKEAKYVQRGAGIPVKYKGEVYWVSYGLPLAQGLNELPFQGVNKEYGKELFRYGISLLAPWWKAAIEVLPVAQGGPGWNYFFESPLQSKTSPFVPAPVIPGVSLKEDSALAKALGIVEYTNRDGVRQMGWEGWKSYLWNIPMTGTPGFAFRIGQAQNQRHQSPAQAGLSFASGAKIDRSDPLSAAISNTFEYIDGLETARGKAKGRYGKESAQYRALNEKITSAKRVLYRLSTARKDKNPYGLAPPSGRRVKPKAPYDPLGLNSTGKSDGDPLGLSKQSSSNSDPLGLN